MTVRWSVILAIGLLAGACGRSSSPAPAPSPNPPPAGGSSVSIVSGASSMTTTAYSPNPINVAVGTSVSWTNNDGIAHTATSDAGAFDTQTIQRGARSNTITFSTAGSFPYHCTIHPRMVGTVNVQ